MLIFFKINISKKKYFRNSLRVSDSLDPDQARRLVGPDLGQNCLQELSADDTSRCKQLPMTTYGNLGLFGLHISTH